MTKLHYKIGIVGLGSIGIRHLNNLHEVLAGKGCTFSIDAIRHDNRVPLEASIQEKLNVVYLEDENIPDDYDVLFIANPTYLHFSTIQRYVKNTRHMFIEKPVFDQTEINIEKLGLHSDSQYYVACPLRYKKVIQFLKTQEIEEKAIGVRVICSSYLPDWRPGKDYRNTYSAHKSDGGGVSIDLIHEWDYIKHLFGNPIEVKSILGRVSSLEIDSDDIAVYLAKFPSLVLDMHLDYFGRVSRRILEIYTNEEVIEVDLLANQVTYLRDGKTVEFSEDRDTYQKEELRHFLDIVEGKIENDNTIENAIHTLKLAKGDI